MEKKFRINELGVRVEILNRYFIINADDPSMGKIDHVIVGTVESQRYSLDGTKLVVKLHKGDYSDYDFLAEYTEYDHDAILEQLNTLEWTWIL
tara:strand:- start:341 stop:619 length:279 start_codon:yes stop_codon:yes gene_type:complete